MLTSLTISNYALIHALEIDFSAGMSVLTGETGAGKSIIIGALSLVQGQRADTRVVREGTQKAIVEAEFELSAYKLKDFFEKNELDYSRHCIIRREVSSIGKSRAFINDTPVSLAVLRELSEKLIDIHSQHENLLLSTDDYQLMVVDAMSANEAERASYLKKFEEWNAARSFLSKLKSDIAKQSADLDYLQFQLSQLQEAALQEGELEELEVESEKLSHVEEIKSALQQADYLMDGEEQDVLSAIRNMSDALGRIADFLPEAEGWSDRLEIIEIDLKDISQDISASQNNIEFDPERLTFIQNRLDLLYSLLKKFNRKSVEELIELREEYHASLSRIENFDDELKAAEENLLTAKAELDDAAEKLHQTRLKSAPVIEKFLSEQSKELGMPDIQFVVQVEKTEEYSERGADRVVFLFSANKNRSVQPVAEIASGGEISRLMLAIKALLVKTSALPTIIFDEIDTGVSGEIAGRVGDIMKQMGTKTQVIVISHLPQIAAKGNAHYKVYKDSAGEAAETFIKQLNDDERVKELASLLSGKTISEAALQNAKDLLVNS